MGSLAFAEELGKRREELLDALERLGAAPRERAIAQLGISAGQAGEVDVDAALRGAPAAAASTVYSGVLYDRLDLPRLPPAARRRAASRVLIASALWGFVRPADRIPYYRLSAKARLDGIGPLAKWWRPALASALPDEEGRMIVDMRSAAYAAAWKPRRATLLAVRAVTEEGGRRRAVTHMAKAVRGEVARALLLSDRDAADSATVAEIVTAAGFRAEPSDTTLEILL